MLLRTYLETERSDVPVNASARRKYKMLHAANSAAVIDFRRNAMVLILYEWLNVILAVLSACRFWLDRLLKAEFAEANFGIFFKSFSGAVGIDLLLSSDLGVFSDTGLEFKLELEFELLARKLGSDLT